LHSPEYLQSAIVLSWPQHAETLGRDWRPGFSRFAAKDVALVISPALGGLIIGHEVARALGVPFFFTERDADRKMSLRRGFTLKPGDRVVVVEDVITTGGSTKEVIDIVRARERFRCRGVYHRSQRRSRGSRHPKSGVRNVERGSVSAGRMPHVQSRTAVSETRLAARVT